MSINWSDPAERLGLIERVGADEYNRLHAEEQKRATVETVNGYAIRAVASRFGRIFMVDGLNRGSPTLQGAREMAAAAPPRG